MSKWGIISPCYIIVQRFSFPGEKKNEIERKNENKRGVFLLKET